MIGSASDCKSGLLTPSQPPATNTQKRFNVAALDEVANLEKINLIAMVSNLVVRFLVSAAFFTTQHGEMRNRVLTPFCAEMRITWDRICILHRLNCSYLCHATATAVRNISGCAFCMWFCRSILKVKQGWETERSTVQYERMEERHWSCGVQILEWNDLPLLCSAKRSIVVEESLKRKVSYSILLGAYSKFKV